MAESLSIIELTGYTLTLIAAGLGLPGLVILLWYSVPNMFYALLLMLTRNPRYEARIRDAKPKLRRGMGLVFVAGVVSFLAGLFL